MAEIDPIQASLLGGQSASSTSATATSNFGVSFDDFLRIVLTQLTFQDPLKPMDNAEFVSQLAQFTQIQQTQQMNDRVQGLMQAAGAQQAVDVLGRRVEILSGDSQVIGKVTAIAFQSGEPRLSVLTAQGVTLQSISLSSVTRVLEGS